jgi:hypothetical protein
MQLMIPLSLLEKTRFFEKGKDSAIRELRVVKSRNSIIE